MHTTAISRLQPAEARLVRWLGLAVLLHAALLLVPIREYGPRTGAVGALNIALLEPPRDALEPRMPTPPRPQPPRAVDPAEPPLARTTEAAAEPAIPPRESWPRESAPAPAPDLSAAHLLELARQRDWRPPRTSKNRQLGVLTPQPPPRNWRSGERGKSRFDGRALPTDVEIVDRWMASDGSHNVLVETPGGELLCGRAKAWDPMRPLVENVMMFRTCGPGTRTFEWPEHYRSRPTSAPDPASG